LALAALLVVDPSFRSTSAVAEIAEGYVTRGESTEQLSSATGRDILWEVLWDSWKESPWIGHGYLVGTRNGLVDVWQVAENRPAHNVWLQALVSTGVVGFLLFVVAMLWLIWLTLHDTFLGRDEWGLASLLSAVLLWQLIWGTMDSSLLGPMRPDTVCFFVLAGILVARTSGSRYTGASAVRRPSTPSPEASA
jgi:O-antigen ligase